MTAPDGFYNKGELKEVTIKPNETIKITLDNKPQQGILYLNKEGEKAVGIETLKTIYGDENHFKFDLGL